MGVLHHAHTDRVGSGSAGWRRGRGAGRQRITPPGSLTVAQVTQRLQAQGFTVGKVKFDDGRYKVKATDATGHKAKLSVNPANGDVMSKGDDDNDD